MLVITRLGGGKAPKNWMAACYSLNSAISLTLCIGLFGDIHQHSGEESITSTIKGATEFDDSGLSSV